MHHHHLHRFLFTIPLLSLLLTLPWMPPVEAATFKLVNKCRHTIWPGLLSGSGTPQLPTTGFALPPAKSKTLAVPASWSGRAWARTHCSQNSSTGRFTCLTADCGSGEIACLGGGAQPPATLAEFTLNGAGGLDFYDVSLVDGYNLPVLVYPKKARSGLCGATGCLVELNGACPRELSVKGRVACKSACEAFGDPRFCCSEGYATPETCGPSEYSLFFKHACPRAYSYAYDDKTSTYTCPKADYVIMFCPPPYTSQKMLGLRKDGAALPLVNKTTMYISSKYANGASSSGR